MIRWKAGAGAGLLALMLSALAGAQGWNVNGTNTLRIENYRVTGDAAAAPYASLGNYGFNEINLNANYRASAFDQWRVQFAGVANASPYRSEFHGPVAERMAIVREDGNRDVPYRLEVGDLLGSYSLRTLQQSIKGGQAEFQLSEGARQQSFIVTAGALQQQWSKFQGGDDALVGGSWLMQDAQVGRYSANWVHSGRAADAARGLLSRTQSVYSVAGEKTLKHAWGQTTLEGEWGHFDGDHDVAQSRQDAGIFGQVGGRSAGGFNYRLRFERYGQDYRPRGAVVSPDRDSREAHAGYSFAKGLQLRGRLQRFVDQWESVNPNTTETAGGTLSGALLPGVLPRLSGSVDAFVQDTFNNTRTSDTTLHSMTANLSHPLGGGVNGRFSLSQQDVDNYVAPAAGTVTRTTGVDADVPLRWQGFNGSFSAGVQFREVSPSNTGQRALSARFAVNAAKGPHSLSLDYNRQDVNLLAPGTTDTRTVLPNFIYRYQSGQNIFGVEYSYNLRQPSPGQDTKGYRMAAFWTYNFDRPARVARAGEAPAAGRPAPAAAGVAEISLLDLAPGADLEAMRKRIAQARIGGGVSQPGAIVYERALLPEVTERQRFALVHDAGKIETAVLVIDPDDTRNATALMQLYERVRRHFLNRLGSPSQFFDRGDVSPALADDIRAGRFIRLTEWKAPAGTVRLGMPRRLDGQVRIEVHYSSRSFAAPTETLWSLESVR